MFYDSHVWIDSKTGFAPNIVLSIHIKKKEKSTCTRAFTEAFCLFAQQKPNYDSIIMCEVSYCYD